MAELLVEWEFGETEADAVAWMNAPSLLHAYVDFRTPETPPGMWQRVMVVTPQVRQRLEEGTGAQSWPSLLVVSAGSLPEARRSINAILAEGGWRIVALNSSRISAADRLSQV